MSGIRRATTDKIYFVTTTIVEWIDLFSQEIYAQVIVDSLNFCSENKGLKVYSVVIMPTHLHLICQSEKGGKLSSLIRDFKRFTSRKLVSTIINDSDECRRHWLLTTFQKHANKTKQNQNYMVWQKSYYPFELYSPRMYMQKENYIHRNPVKAKLVEKACDFRLSSANPDCPILLAG